MRESNAKLKPDPIDDIIKAGKQILLLIFDTYFRAWDERYGSLRGNNAEIKPTEATINTFVIAAKLFSIICAIAAD